MPEDDQSPPAPFRWVFEKLEGWSAVIDQPSPGLAPSSLLGTHTPAFLYTLAAEDVEAKVSKKRRIRSETTRAGRL